MNFAYKPAADYPLPDLIEFLNQGFKNYLIPIHVNMDEFLSMLRKDGIDLSASRVLLIDEQPAGVALMARRGWQSRLAAMGISLEIRGQGAGSWQMAKLIDEARQRGDRAMVLEVIEQNIPAVRVYQKYGFQMVRRLLSFVRKDTQQAGADILPETDLRELGHMILQYGLSDLPWQLSGESVAQMNPPARAYRKGQAYVAISNPDAGHIVIWSLLVEPGARGRNLSVDILKALIATHPGKTWHVPALFPEEMGKVFERAGFQKEELSQLQMKLTL